MPTKSELERKSLTELAVLCGEIDGNSSSDRSTADKAHVLRLEWVQLQNPPRSATRERKELEAQRESLRKRMVEFLAGAL